MQRSESWRAVLGVGTGVPLRTWGVSGGFSYLVNFKLFLTFVREELSQKLAGRPFRHFQELGSPPIFNGGGVDWLLREWSPLNEFSVRKHCFTWRRLNGHLWSRSVVPTVSAAATALRHQGPSSPCGKLWVLRGTQTCGWWALE